MTNLTVIMGPCVIESLQMSIDVAGELKEITRGLGVEYIFKSSFDKANRTAVSAPRGPGLEEGLSILEQVKSQIGVKVLTDVHETNQVNAVASVVDIIQIPALLCRQTPLILESASYGKPVNIKKGQWMSPQDTISVAEKALSTGNKDIWITERGHQLGYNDLVVDFRSLEILRRNGITVVMDASHSCQSGKGINTTTGGDRSFVPIFARAAVVNGIDKIFCEVHPDPNNARSDAATQYPLDKIKPLIEELVRIKNIVG